MESTKHNTITRWYVTTHTHTHTHTLTLRYAITSRHTDTHIEVCDHTRTHLAHLEVCDHTHAHQEEKITHTHPEVRDDERQHVSSHPVLLPTRQPAVTQHVIIKQRAPGREVQPIKKHLHQDHRWDSRLSCPPPPPKQKRFAPLLPSVLSCAKFPFLACSLQVKQV